MSLQDDGSRDAAVRELGEDAVRAAEVEIVKANADRLSIATFRAMGIPATSILEGLGLDAESASGRPALVPPRVSTATADPCWHHTRGAAAPGPGVGR
jgi:hypothetical protein